MRSGHTGLPVSHLGLLPEEGVEPSQQSNLNKWKQGTILYSKEGLNATDNIQPIQASCSYSNCDFILLRCSWWSWFWWSSTQSSVEALEMVSISLLCTSWTWIHSCIFFIIPFTQICPCFARYISHYSTNFWIISLTYGDYHFWVCVWRYFSYCKGQFHSAWFLLSKMCVSQELIVSGLLMLVMAMFGVLLNISSVIYFAQLKHQSAFHRYSFIFIWIILLTLAIVDCCLCWQ